MKPEKLQAQLKAFATQDINRIKDNSAAMVTDTKKGHVEIERAGTVYTIRTMGKINFVTAERESELLYQGSKEGAILYLAGLYDVVQG